MSDAPVIDPDAETPEVTEDDEANLPEGDLPEANDPEGEANDPEAVTEETRTRNAPSYNLTKVSGLPEEAPGGRGRSSLYFDLLSQITEDPGEWYEVANFQTPNGAQDVKKALDAGERTIPDGEWEFASRKVVNAEKPAGPKHSKLFARFLG